MNFNGKISPILWEKSVKRCCLFDSVLFQNQAINANNYLFFSIVNTIYVPGRSLIPDGYLKCCSTNLQHSAEGGSGKMKQTL